MPLTPNELLRTSSASDVVSVTKANGDLPGGICRGCGAAQVEDGMFVDSANATGTGDAVGVAG